MRLKNKIALVTGSSTGIGEAIAGLYAKEGAKVMIHGLDRAESEETARRIQKETGSSADFFVGDIVDAKVCTDLVAATVKKFGGIDILVNNAAIKTRDNLETATLETFERTMNINLRAPFLLMQLALPHFRKAGRGWVVNIGSVNGYCGENNQLTYSMSKAGLQTLTRNIADAYGRENILVNHINPGWILTKNEQKLQASFGNPADWEKNVNRAFAVSGRLLRPEELAQYALVFVLEESGPVNGAVIDVEQYPFIGRNPDKQATGVKR